MSALADALRKHIDTNYDSMRKRPAMWGTPSEIEATWFSNLMVEGILLYPTRDPREIRDAHHAAHMKVANSRKQGSCVPLYVHAKGREDLLVMLDALHEAFLEHLTKNIPHPPSVVLGSRKG